MDIQTLLDKIRAWGGEEAWVYQVFAVVLAVVIANLLLRFVLHKIHLRAEKTENAWDDAFIDSLGRPLRILFWIIGLAFAAQITQKVSDVLLFEAIDPVRDVGVIACIAWFLTRFIRAVERNLVTAGKVKGKEIDYTTADAVSRLLRISVIITAVLVALQTLGYSISGVLAFGGIGGVAVGFAAKDLLANFFGGMMIFLDRPFAVGDWIRSADREIEGTVENIGWRQTRIRTFDKRPLYVPNSTFATIAVENPSRMSHRRIYETIGIRYDDIEKMPEIVKDVENMLLNHDEIDTSQTLMVNFNSFAASSLDFFVYTFTKTTSWTKFHEVKQDVLLKIADIISRHGAEIAFPTSTIHMAEITVTDLRPQI
jgi:MscS family membrane protein